MTKSLKIIKTFSLGKTEIGQQFGIDEAIADVYFEEGACAPDGSFHALIKVYTQTAQAHGFLVVYTDDGFSFQKIPDDHPILQSALILRLDDGFLMCRGVQQAYWVTRIGSKWSPIQCLKVSNQINPTKTSSGVEVFFGIGQNYPISLSGDVGIVRMEAPQHYKLLALQLDRKKHQLEWQLWPSGTARGFPFFQKAKKPDPISAEQMIELDGADFPIDAEIRTPETRIADCTAWYNGQAYSLSNGVDKFSKAGDEITALSRISKNGAVIEHLLYRDHMANRTVKPNESAYFKQGASGHFVDSNSKLVLRLLDPQTEKWIGPLEIFDLETRTLDRFEIVGDYNPLWLNDCQNDRYWFVDGLMVTVAAS